MTAWLLRVAGALGLSLLGCEFWGWLPRCSKATIWLWTRILPTNHREERYEEWVAELLSEYRERRISGLVWSLALLGVCVWEAATELRPRRLAATLLGHLHAALVLWLSVATGLAASGHLVWATVALVVPPLPVVSAVGYLLVLIWWLSNEESRDTRRLCRLAPTEFSDLVELYLHVWRDDDEAAALLENLTCVAREQARLGNKRISRETAMDLAELLNHLA
jgi:hypothetical protein